jgi:hypothetical protein
MQRMNGLNIKQIRLDQPKAIGCMLLGQTMISEYHSFH